MLRYVVAICCIIGLCLAEHVDSCLKTDDNDCSVAMQVEANEAEQLAIMLIHTDIKVAATTSLDAEGEDTEEDETSLGWNPLESIIDLLPNQHMKSIPVDLHSKMFNNWVVCLVGVLMVVLGVLGYLLDNVIKPSWLKCSATLWILLMASYATLYPGLFATEFSFLINFVVPDKGVVQAVTTEDNTLDGEARPIKESTISLIGLLNRTGSHIGAFFVLFYAVIVPAVKFCMLVLGEWWRFSPNVHRVRIAQACFGIVKLVSKWASPDMMAYLLLFFGIRKVENQRAISVLGLDAGIETKGGFDIGFTCYVYFCIVSTAATLALKTPELPKDSMIDAEKAVSVQHPLLSRVLGTWKQQTLKRALLLVTLCLSLVSVVLFILAVHQPIMSLSVDNEIIIKKVPKAFRDLASLLLSPYDLGKILGFDVSIWTCTWFMWQHAFLDGTLNLFLGFVIMFVFVLMFTLLSLIVTIFVAFRANADTVEANISSLRFLSSMLKHLSLLDVMGMGVIVICYAAKAYDDMGVIITINRAIQPLVVAEVLHYIAYYLAWNVVDYLITLEKHDATWDETACETKSKSLNAGVSDRTYADADLS